MSYNSYIGVMGNPYPQRSNMDIKMQNEFGAGVQELYVNSGIGVVGPDSFGQRSIMDRRMQQEFNPYYRRSVEGYCGGSPRVSNTFMPSVAISNPNIQTKGKITYVPIQ